MTGFGAERPQIKDVMELFASLVFSTALLARIEKNLMEHAEMQPIWRR